MPRDRAARNRRSLPSCAATIPQHLRRCDVIAADAAEHSCRVRDHIAAKIHASGGWLSFEQFMDLALYAPGLGYYSGGAPKTGAPGALPPGPEGSRFVW